MDVVEQTYKKLRNKVNNIINEGPLDKEIFEKYNSKFIEYLCDDLNTANAITVLYDVIKDNINGTTKLELIKSFDKVLSLDLIHEIKLSDKHDYIVSKIEERKIAKQNKNFILADTIREELAKEGIILFDTREGTTYKIEEK